MSENHRGSHENETTYIPLKVRRQQEQQLLDEARLKLQAQYKEEYESTSSSSLKSTSNNHDNNSNQNINLSSSSSSSSSNTTQSLGPKKADKTLLEINMEILEQRGGIGKTQEEIDREEEELLLRHVTLSRAPLAGRKEVAGAQTRITKRMDTGWRPPRQILELSEDEIVEIRKTHNIDVTGEDIPPPLCKFSHMRFPPFILSGLKAKGITNPTPIQIQGLPVVLAGRDMIGVAFTGSGKSMVFTLPLIMFALQQEAKMPLRSREGPIGIVLVPQRELASQTADGFKYFTKIFLNEQEVAHKAALEAKEKEINGNGMNTVNTRGDDRDEKYDRRDRDDNYSRTNRDRDYNGRDNRDNRRYNNRQSNQNTNKIISINTLLCIGGINMQEQWSAIPPGKGLHIVVATPGRLTDFLETKKLILNRCIYLAMDEADRLVDEKFEENMRSILDAFTGPRQTVLFSATMPPKVQQFALSALIDPVTVSVGRAGAANLDVIQEVESVKADLKMSYLLECLQKTAPPVVVFANSQRNVDLITEYLMYRGVDAVSVHGGIEQEERLRAITSFRDEKADVLVATDVASKGLDFPNIQHVINFDMPREIEDYIHRIGRTGRSGKTGVATSFVNKDSKEEFLLDLKSLLREAKQRIPPLLMELDDPRDLLEEGHEDKVCELCGGLGHRVLKCPKLAKKNASKIKNTYGFDIDESTY